MLVGDSITDGHGSSDTKTWKYGWGNLLELALQSIDSSFKVLDKGKGERCVNHNCPSNYANDTSFQ